MLALRSLQAVQAVQTVRAGRCAVTTWSPLATAFNTHPASNPFLDTFKEKTGLFNKPELTSPEGFYILQDKAISTTDDLIEEAISGTSSRPMVEIFDDLSDTLCQVADLAEFVRIAHPQAAYRKAAEDACISISGVVEKLNTHQGLYAALKRAVQRGDSGDQHVASLFLVDFEQSGIHLEEAARRRVVTLNDTILQAGQRFMAGAAEPRLVPREAVPRSVRHMFPSVAAGSQLVVGGACAESDEPAAREAAYRLYLAPDDRQERLLRTVLGARRDLAAVCGFGCYADRAVRGGCVDTAGDVREFLTALSDSLRERAERDFATMAAMKRGESPHQPELACWDAAHYAHRARRELLGADGAEATPYFSLGACMEGLAEMCRELYGVTLEPEPLAPGEGWAPDVRKLAVHDERGPLGHVYCDLFARPDKPPQDCHFTIRGGRSLGGSYRPPAVVVCLSLSAARARPPLLSPGALLNLFHEAGHALHAVLGRAHYQHVSGTRCHTDLAELPSLLSEQFASCPALLSRFARHFQTRAPAPPALLERLRASLHVFAASEMQLQVFYSALDQRYHGADEAAGGQDTGLALRQEQAAHYGLPHVARTAWQHRFGHLVGYGAKYYSYLVSRALAWTVWRDKFAERPLCRAAGDGFREGVLRHGGAVAPRILLADYLDGPPAPRRLAAALLDELDHQDDLLRTHATAASRR